MPRATTHLVYGLSIRSSLPLPGVPCSTDAVAPHVHVTLGRLPDHIHSPQKQRPIYPPAPSASAADGASASADRSLYARQLDESGDFWLTYEDGTEFVIDTGGSRVWASWPQTLTLEDAATYFLGPVMGFLLRVRGTLCLHASVVAVDGHGVAFVGPPGAGKSTLAAAFADEGFAVLSDDVAPLLAEEPSGGDGFMILPGYPRLRLWPDSLQALYGSADPFPPITPTWDKRHVELGSDRHPFCDRPLPLSAIYLLHDWEAREAPAVDALTPRAALMALVANTYANYLIGRDTRVDEFGQLERLIAAAPVRRVRPPADLHRTREIVRTVVADLRAG